MNVMALPFSLVSFHRPAITSSFIPTSITENINYRLGAYRWDKDSNQSILNFDTQLFNCADTLHKNGFISSFFILF